MRLSTMILTIIIFHERVEVYKKTKNYLKNDENDDKYSNGLMIYNYYLGVIL